MRSILLTIMIVVLSSCSTKDKGAHADFKKFSKDIQHCLKKSCINKTKNVLYNISIISTALAYGGGGGGGGGSGSSLQKDKISYKVFNLCMEDKGYFKDENGIFQLPDLNCS